MPPTPERTAQLMADPLFEMGNHAWSHADLRIASAAKVRREINGTQSAYADVYNAFKKRDCAKSAFKAKAIPPVPKFFRFPFGRCTKASLAAVNKAGMAVIQWDLPSGDPARGLSANRLANSVIARTKPGSIVVMHANSRGYQTGEALPRIIKTLKAKGYSFVTVGELLKAGKPQIVSTCYDRRPGDLDGKRWTLARSPKSKKK